MLPETKKKRRKNHKKRETKSCVYVYELKRQFIIYKNYVYSLVCSFSLSGIFSSKKEFVRKNDLLICVQILEVNKRQMKQMKLS